MDTLFGDLLGLINNYLDVVQESLIDPTKEHVDLNPTTNFKVWLHMFYKSQNQLHSLKILYNNRNTNTLKFIGVHGNEFASSWCRNYLNFIKIEKGLFHLPHKIAYLYCRSQCIKIAARACEDRNLEVIKKLYLEQYFDNEVVVEIFEYGYRYKWFELIEFMRSIYGDASEPEVDGIIRSKSKHGLPLVIEHFRHSRIIRRQYIIKSCFKYNNYDLLLKYEGDSLISKCCNCWTEIENMHPRVKVDKSKLFLYSLANGDDQFSLDLLEHINPKDNLIHSAIRYGASDTIINAILQKWPDQVKSLKFDVFRDFNPAPTRQLSPALTSKSIKNVGMHRGGFSDEELKILKLAFVRCGRYDLVSSL